MDLLITGHSRGIGAALCDYYLEHDAHVFGISRTQRATALAGLYEYRCDFSEPETIASALDALIPAGATPELVFLNAGILGPIAPMRELSLSELREVLDVNVWANKAILDWLQARSTHPKQIVLLSSGASHSGHVGWGAYALSKAALNMLAQLYAREMTDTHLCALAPGLVDTGMQTALRTYSADAFPSLGRLHAAAGTDAMPTPDTAARRIAESCPALLQTPSGGFVDLRNFLPQVGTAG